MHRFFMLIGLVIGVFSGVLAQLPQYHAQVFGAEQGIGAGGIQDIFQDRTHFLWVVNSTNLQRFDGRNVHTYPFAKAITQAICDRDNQIWVLSDGKLWCKKTESAHFQSILFDTTGGVQPRAIFQLGKQPLYVLTTKGVFAFQHKKETFVRLPHQIPAPLAYTNLWRFTVKENTIFYQSQGFLQSYNFENQQLKSLPVSEEVAYIVALTPDLIALSDFTATTFWYNFKNETITTTDPLAYRISDRPFFFGITGAAALGAGKYLVTSRLGTFEYDLTNDRFKKERIYAAGKPLELEEMLARVFFDKNGVAWAHNSNNVIAAGCLQNTLGLLRNYHYEPPRFWSNRVVGLAKDNAGNLWFGGSNGFNKLHLASGQVTPYPVVPGATSRLSHNSVRGMGFDGKYVIVGPTDKGVWLFDPKTEQYRRPTYVNDRVKSESERDFIDQLTVLSNGDIVIAARFHPYRIAAGTYRMDFIQFPGDDTNMNIAYEDSKGNIWLGSLNQLFKLNSNYTLQATYPIESVHCIAEKNDGEMLIGTVKGLRGLRPDAAKVDTILTPQEGNVISFIFQDQRQRFWLGTTEGLYLADADFKIFKKFDFSDNIQSLVFNGSGALRMSNGMTFFAGINGMNYLYPEQISLEDHPLAVSLQSLRINDRDSLLPVPGRFQLPFRENTLTFEVVAPYFNNAGKVQYRYRLRGRSEEWVPTGGSNQIRLADLRPSDYELEVAASTTGQTWYTIKNPIEITIQPPFWQTWLFRIATALALGSLLYSIVVLREKRWKKEQKAQLELERLRNTNLLYQLEMEQVIHYFSRSISAKSTVAEALWSVAQDCIAKLNLEDCVIYLLDSTRQTLVQKAAWGQKSMAHQQIINPIEIPVGQGIVGTVALTGNPELIADTTADARYIVDDAVRHSELTVPILLEDQVIGVIDTEHSQKNFYTPWHLQILTAISALCSNKIALAQTEEARQQALLEAVDNQRKAAEAKLQSMRLQMNPHFLFNALNSIQQMILSGNTEGAALYLSKFSKLLRLVLMYSDYERVSLREEVNMLYLYIELEALRFDDTFTYSIEIEEDVDAEEYKVPPLLIQPFVENAIWHGLLQKEGIRLLKICFATNADEDLICTIEDNGIGREAAQAYARNGVHTGKGVGVSAERVEVLNRQYGTNNKLKIIDLQHSNGQAAGTRVEIVLT